MSKERFMGAEKQGFTAVKVALYKNGRYLILHKSGYEDVDPNTYDLPGGRMEFGERPEETVSRELLEETGIKGDIIGVLDNWITLTNNLRLVVTGFFCRFRSGEEKLSREHTELLWKSPEEINNDDNLPVWIKKIIIKAEEYRETL